AAGRRRHLGRLRLRRGRHHGVAGSGTQEPVLRRAAGGVEMSQTLERHSEQPGDGPRRRRWTSEEDQQMVNAGIITAGERVEHIGGEIIQMTAQKTAHFAALSLAARACGACFGGGYWVRVQGPLELDESSMPE